jgi:predicted permease
VNFIVSALTLIVPLAAGYLGARAGVLQRAWSKRIQRLSMMALGPPVTFLAMWSLKISGLDILGVPLIGMAVCLGGMAAAYPMARMLKLSRPAAGD